MLVKISGTGEILQAAEGGKLSHEFRAGYKPSSEYGLHLQCYKQRPDVGAVIHAHSPCATAFALANKPIDGSLLVELTLTIGDVPVAPFARAGTAEVAESIAPFLAEHDVILLQNHGAVAVGRDLQEAFNRMETLELCAKTILLSKLL
jgi:L-fuculose-phosphate aldolase